VGSGLPAP